MTQNGLWGEAALDRVAANLRAGTVLVEATVVHDTTHYHAYSAMQVLDLAAELAGGDGISEPVTGDATAAVADPSQEQHAGGPAELAAETPEPAPSSAASSAMTAGVRAVNLGAAKAAFSPEKPEKTGTCSQSAPRKKKRKSHPRTTKACRCADREHCHHAWVNADEGAGTVVKGRGQMYWGHKASTLGFPGQEVLLDAVRGRLQHHRKL